jgi:predicted HD phosphohydrolase
VEIASRRLVVPSINEGNSRILAQGGLLRTDERERFEARPGLVAAMAPCSWDDRAKVPGREVPDLGHYRCEMGKVAAHRDASRGI